jgi:hypothetical protein
MKLPLQLPLLVGLMASVALGCGSGASALDAAPPVGSDARAGAGGSEDASDGRTNDATGPGDEGAADAAASDAVTNDAVASDAMGLDADTTTPAGFCAAWMVARARWDRCKSFGLQGRNLALAPQPYACPRLVASIAAGRTGFDPAKAQSCLQSLIDSSCEYYTGYPTRDPLPCAGLIPEVALGGACSPYALAPECVGTAYCRADAAGSCTGTCVAGLSLGAGCQSDVECESRRCDPTRHCRRSSGPLSGPCTMPGTNFDCGGYQYCQAASAGAATGTCTPETMNGPCSASGVECFEGYATCMDTGAGRQCVPISFTRCLGGTTDCADGFFCDHNAACQPATGNAALECGAAAHHPVLCWDDTVCDPTSSTCIDAKKPGEACGAGPDFLCGFDSSARCDAQSKTCVVCER